MVYNNLEGTNRLIQSKGKNMEAKLLIIDDEEPLRNSIRDYLERDGYHVFVAKDGEEGWRTINTFEMRNGCSAARCHVLHNHA